MNLLEGKNMSDLAEDLLQLFFSSFVGYVANWKQRDHKFMKTRFRRGRRPDHTSLLNIRFKYNPERLREKSPTTAKIVQYVFLEFPVQQSDQRTPLIFP